MDYLNMHKHRFFNRYGRNLIWTISVCAAIILNICTFGSAQGQGVTQVNITGIPSVLSSPYTDQIEENFRNGRYQVMFTYNSSTPGEVDFVFDFTLSRNGRELISITSEPVPLSPGTHTFPAFFEEIPFSQNYRDVLDQLPGNIRNQVVQAGTVPEGQYRLELEARAAQMNSGITSTPGVTMFNVRYPQPPTLVTPSDGANLIQEMPTFSWTPVVANQATSFEYDFLLVEVLENQTPLQAINSNRAHAERTVTGRTTLNYTPEFLPLDEGATYAWQVTASDLDDVLPIRNEGSSEIQTFTYKKEVDNEQISEIRQLEELPLVPGFASLTNLGDLDVQEAGNAFILDGSATLRLNFDGSGEIATSVGVQDLRLQKESLNNPVLLGGSVSGSAPDLEDFLGRTAGVVDPGDVIWTLDGGLRITAAIETPEEQRHETEGELQLQRTGLNGRIKATVPEGETITQFGEDPFSVQVRSVTAIYPEETVMGSGRLEAFGEVPCEISNISLETAGATTFVDCEVNESIELVNQTGKLQLTIRDITGQFSAAWAVEDEFSYTTSIRSGITLELEEPVATDARCGAAGTVILSDEDGVEARNFTPDCSYSDPSLNLGFLNLDFYNPELVSLGYISGGEWDFEFRFDADLYLPAAPDIKMPRLEDVTLTPQGIEFPDVQFDEDVLQPNMVVDLDPFELALTRFELNSPIFPWFEWDGTGLGPWDFIFDAAVTFPDHQNYPPCLRNAEVDYIGAKIADSRVTGDLQANIGGQCRWEFGPGYALEISDIDGEFQILYDEGELAPASELELDAVAELGEPFSCEPPENEIAVEDLSLTADATGFTAEVENVVPQCPMSIGPYSGTITESSLSLSSTSGDPLTATLEGQADLDLGENRSASGSFTLNLATGEFSELEFDLQGPFEWGIPKENSVLVFQVDEASLTEQGIHIDGRQTLLLGEETMGVTFDELVVNWRTFQVESGRIILDETFSFLAGINPDTQELDYTATLQDSSLTMDPGALLNLAGTATIDSLGLRVSGRSGGELNFGDLSLDDIEITYSNDFAMRLYPFGVRKGQAEIYSDDQRIAVIDESGFNPDVSFFGDQFLPERIPLPTEEIAYLQIKQNDQLVVETTRQQDGNVMVETLPGEFLELVVPALQGTNAQAPAVEVTLNNLVVNPSTGNYISGTVRADVPANSPQFDLEQHGIPLTLDEIIYATQTVNNNQFSALFLNGNLTILDQELDENGQVSLFIKSDGRVKGSVNIPSLDQEIPLDPNSEMVVFNVDSVAGNLDVPVLNQGQPDFEFNMSGGFRVKDFEGEPVAEAGLGARWNDQGFSVTDFDASALTGDATIDLQYFRFTIDRISSLSLDYSETTGFDYFADLDFTLEMLLPNGKSIEIPLKHVDIRNDLGFVIPQQDIHDGSTPRLNAPDFDLGIFRLRPLAFRMDRDTVDIHNLSANDLLDLVPEVDLELTFPTFNQEAPKMTQQSVTLNGVGFDQGILTGSIEPYTVPDGPAHVPLGPTDLYIDEISGGLFETSENQQGVDVEVSGYFGMPDLFAGSGEYCEDTRVDLNLNSEGGFEGTVQDFLPCGEIEHGPLTLWFGSSELDLAFSEGEQIATIDGTGNAEIERENQNPVSASGSMMFDLMEGEILSGSLSLNGPFSWNLPADADDPLFVLTVQSALLNSSGIIFTGSGDLEVGDGSVTTTFNDFALSLQDGSVVGGSMEILNNFAFDVSFSTTRWQVSDPNEDVSFMAGARFVMPPNLVLDQSGITVDGQSSASLRYGEESYAGLSLDFVDMTLGMQPFGVTSGRADLYLKENADSTRLGYYDFEGFHPDNIAASVPMPDTLWLPTKEVAYIVLKNDEGQNLIQSQSVSNGLELYTAENESVPLVLAGLDDGQGGSPRVDVSFSDVVIDPSYKVISGSITADVSETPLNLADYGDYPIGLTALRFQKLQNQPHKLYADAKLSLPESLQELQVIVEDIILGPGGFTEASFSAGTYTTAHTEGDAPVVASHEFSDGAFAFAVRGVELNFGDSPSYQFSGDVSSSFLTDADGDTSNVHFAADYTGGSWGFALDTDHLTPQELPIGQAKLILDSVGSEFSQNNFDIVLDGRIGLSELTGEDFEIGLEGLRVGTSGVSIDEVDTGDMTPQNLSLFGQTDNFTINDLGLSITNENHLLLAMDGSLSFMDRSFDFNDFKVGTGGTFEIGDGNVNLIDPSQPVELMEQHLVLTELLIGIENNKATLTASGDATLPEPITSTSTIDITVDHQGNASVEGPTFELENVSAELGDIAKLNLTGAGLQVQDIHQSQLALFASAELVIDGDVIEFGQPGGPDDWGIRYRMDQKKLEWKITNSPTFAFETGFFELGIQNVSMLKQDDQEQQAFGVSIDANAGFKLDGIGGAGLQLEGFEISTDGVQTMGDVAGGSFDIAGAVNVEVGSFDWGRDQEIEIEKQSSSDGDDPNDVEKSTTESIQVEEFLRFGNETFGDENAESAVNITIGDKDGMGLAGEIQEIFYYKKSESLYLNIEGAKIQLNDRARLFASLEYEKQPNGFRLRVAGGGAITPPTGPEVGLAAMGRMSNLNNEFSFGIFVAVNAEIPITPGVVTLTKAGGGFFYKAKTEDFDVVADITGYKFYNEKRPWTDKEDEYKFAVALFAGVSFIGTGSASAVQGQTMVLITDQWMAMDVQAEILDQGNSLSAGMYLEVEWGKRFSISGGVGADVNYPVLKGNLEVDFTVKEKPGGGSGGDTEVVWAIDGDGKLEIIGGIAKAETSFIVNDQGFYTELKVSQGFDVAIISVSSTWEGAIWRIQETKEFGAYVEIGFDATLFKVASVGGTLKGALLVEDGYLVYASASAYVRVFMVFEGNVSVWVSMKDGKFDGGKGANKEYESMVADAREQAKNLGEQMEEAVAAAEEMQSLPEITRVSEEALAAAGQNLLSSGSTFRKVYLEGVIDPEENMDSGSPQIHRDIKNLIVQGESRPVESDYNLSGLRADMNQKIDELTDGAERVHDRLDETYTLALEWEETAETLMDETVSDPVQHASMEWEDASDTPPSFTIDSNQEAQNQQALEEMKQAIEQLDERYGAAIDSVAGFIDRIDEALSFKIGVSGKYNSSTGKYEFVDTGESQVGANFISEDYVRATKAIDQFYGNYVAYRWKLSRWASNQLSDFQNLRGGSMRDAVISANESMLEQELTNVNSIDLVENGDTTVNVTPENYSLSDSEMKTMADVAIARVWNLHGLNPNLHVQQVINKKDEFKNKWNNDYSDIGKLTNFIIKGIEFWYDMPRLGFIEIRDSSVAQAERMASKYQESITPMKDAHESYTETVDNVYKVKASLTMTLHGMVDVYAARRADIAGDTAVADLNRQKEELEENLTPPVIEGIKVSKKLSDYNNKVTLSWNASHESGSIVESSYNMSDGDSANLFQSMQEGLLSTGGQNEVTRYLFKRNENETDRNMRVAIRARGPSGTAISRPATFSAAVDKFGSSQGSAESGSGSTESIEVADDSPPLKPSVNVPYNKSDRITTTYSQTVDREMPVFETNYWTNQTSEIVFTAWSLDFDSDISGYEYALGSSKGGTDIRGWTEAQGKRLARDKNSNRPGADNYYQKITIRNLDISEGPHYLMVRAINGTGVKSEVAELSNPIKYDGDPPTAPDISPGDIQMPPLNRKQSNYQESTSTVPDREDPPAVSEETPEISFQWSSATDEKSGIYGYEYTLSETADGSSAFSDPAQVDSTTETSASVKGDPMDFNDEVYIHIRSIDKAGVYSDEIATHGPITPRDPTRPLTPKVMAAGKPGKIGVYLVRPSIDPETQVDHYEYTAMEGFYSGNLFSWRDLTLSSSSMVSSPIMDNILYDYAAAGGSSNQGSSARFMEVPKEDLPEGEQVNLKIRAVNGQGAESGTGFSGPVVYDSSPPENPSISLSNSGDDMTIRVSNIHDPESGISKVEYIVSNPNSFSANMMWTSFMAVDGTERSTLGGSRTVDISGQNFLDMRVSIRITNGNGMQTTVSETPTVGDVGGSDQTNYNFDFDLEID